MSFSRTAVAVASIILGLFTVQVIPANAQVIHACVNNSSGDMNIVPAGATCPRNSSPLSWNVAGPPGPPGQGGRLLVDAKGQTVGDFLFNFDNSSVAVLRQINGVWVWARIGLLAKSGEWAAHLPASGRRVG